MSLNEAKNNAVTESVENGSPKQDQTCDLSDTEDSQDTFPELPGFPDPDAILEPYPNFKAFYQCIFPSKDRIQKNTSPLKGTKAKEKVQPSDGQCKKCNLQGQMKLQEEIKLLKMKMEEQKELLTKVSDTFNVKGSKAIAAFKATFDIVSDTANSADEMADEVTTILVKQGQSVEQGDPGFKQYLKDYLNEYAVTKQDIDRISTTFCTWHNRLITENCDFINKRMDDLRKAVEKLTSTVEGIKEIVSKENYRQLQTMHCRAPIMSHPNSSYMSSNENSAPLDYTFKHLNSIHFKKKINDDIHFISKRKHIFRDQSIQKKQYSRYFREKTIPPYSINIGCMDVNRNAEDQQQMHQNDVRKDSVKVIIADVSKPHENSAFTNNEDKNVTHSPGEKVKIEPKRQKIGTANSQPSTGVTIMNKMPLRDKNINSLPLNMNDNSNVTVVQAKPLFVNSNQFYEKLLNEEDSNENIGASVTSPVPHPKKRKKKNAQWRKDKIPKENTLNVPAKEKETFPIEDDDCVIVDEKIGTANSQPSTGVTIMNKMPLQDRNVNGIPLNMNDSSNVTVVQAKPLFCENLLNEEDSNENIGASVTSPVPHLKKYKKNDAQLHKDKNPKENAVKVAPAKKKETFQVEDDDCIIVGEISGIQKHLSAILSILL